MPALIIRLFAGEILDEISLTRSDLLYFTISLLLVNPTWPHQKRM